LKGCFVLANSGKGGLNSLMTCSTTERKDIFSHFSNLVMTSPRQSHVLELGRVDQIAGHERYEITRQEIARHKNAGHENAGHENDGPKMTIRRETEC